MVIKKHILAFAYFSLILFGAIPLFGMKRSRAFFEGRSKRVVKAIDATKKGGFAGVETPFFSDKKVIDSLCNAAERGVKTRLHVASRSKADQKKLKEAGVHVTVLPGLHAKRCLTSDKNPKSKKYKFGDEKKSRVLVGSDNLSFCSQFHREVMAETKNDSGYFKQNYKLFKTPDTSKTKKKKIVKVTPAKRKALGSLDTLMNQSKARRFRKLASEQGKGNSVDITSMTFDNEDIVSEVEDMYSKCDKGNKPQTRLILDRSALKHKDLLDRVKEAGGDDVSIHIFNEDQSKKVFGKFPQIQHTKTLTRECDGKKLSVVSTGNLANRSDTDFNVDSYHPGDEKLFRKIRRNNRKLVKECEEYKGS